MAARRRVGERLRAEVRTRRRQFVRDFWPQLLLVAVVWFAGLAALVALMAWWPGGSAPALVAGIGLGGFSVGAAAVFRVADPRAARLYAGLDGEQFTASELHKLGREGWRSVPNINFRDGEVDFVAVGPGGVVIVEAKSSAAEWSFLQSTGVVTRWASQADQGAVRVRSLVRQLCGVVVEPVAMVVGWIADMPKEAFSLDRGVVGVHGAGVRKYLSSLPRVLDQAQVETIAAALDTAADGFARHNPITPQPSSGWRRGVRRVQRPGQ